MIKVKGHQVALVTDRQPPCVQPAAFATSNWSIVINLILPTDLQTQAAWAQELNNGLIVQFNYQTPFI